MQAMESIGVSRNIVAFVIPTGYSFNLDGTTTLDLSLASIFVAQAVGVDLSMGQQLLMGFTLVFASKGAAGIPRASLIVLAGTLASFGLPVQGGCCHPWRRRNHGYGEDGPERNWQLSRISCDGTVGGQVCR
jgi:Na+/H+-dicarboxylate symporter